MGFGKNLCTTIFQYSQFYFVTIAVTLGGGVLGLPVTLVDSGFLPFLITISASYIVQILTLLFFTEVLQKAYYQSVDKLRESDSDNIPINIETYELPTYGSQDNLVAKRACFPIILFNQCLSIEMLIHFLLSSSTFDLLLIIIGETAHFWDSTINHKTYNTETIEQCLPNLHSLGEIFLPSFLSYLSTFTIFAVLVVFLISYAIVGSQSFAILLDASVYQVAPIFSWTSIFITIFLYSLISPIISILTLFNGAFFTATVILTFVAGLQNRIPVTNDFNATMDSFLMSIVTLAGFWEAMPLLFGRAQRTRNGIIGYNVAIFLGLTTCYILNILWCWSVLAIVPQHSVCLPNNNTKLMQMSLNLFHDTQAQCVKSPSLENSAATGEVAIVPLTIILENEQNSASLYISILIQVFIAISVSVSFLTSGAILYHTLNGVIDSFLSSSSESGIQDVKTYKYLSVQLIRQWFLSLIVFTVIFAIAYSNPKSFQVFVEQAGSFFIAIETGIFVALMIHKATYSSQFSSYVLPFQLPRWFLPFQYIIPIYYIFAIIYNLYITIASF